MNPRLRPANARIIFSTTMPEDDASQKRKEDVDTELDKSLEDLFPSSDPPAVSQPTKTEPAGDPRTKP